ncbi:MAG: lipoyl domain-containing protein [Phycisphaerae bacterium]
MDESAVKRVQWYMPDGAIVRAGELICLIESDKTSLEVEADRDGILVHLKPAEDELLAPDPRFVRIDPLPDP